METDSAVRLISDVIYKPGWKFRARPHTDRFEGVVNVCITYPAMDSGSNSHPDTWEEGYQHAIKGGAHASFPLVVGDVEDDVELYRRLLKEVIAVEEHEAREFLRIKPTGWAPFHPHRIDGMKRWGDFENDLHFGLA